MKKPFQHEHVTMAGRLHSPSKIWSCGLCYHPMQVGAEGMACPNPYCRQHRVWFDKEVDQEK